MTIVVTAANIFTLDPDLDGLAQQIEESHARTELAAEALVECIIDCGQRLLEARAKVPNGHWGKWVRENLTMHPKTARDYIKFAIHAEVLRANLPDSRLAAKRLLQRMDLPRLNAADEQKTLAKRMKAEGMTQQQIADYFHVSAARVSQWLNPERAKQLDRKRQAKQAKAKRLLKKDENNSVVRKGHRDISVAYTHLRKCLDALDKVAGPNAECRRAVTAAIDALHKAEDEIVKASKASVTKMEW